MFGSIVFGVFWALVTLAGLGGTWLGLMEGTFSSTGKGSPDWVALVVYCSAIVLGVWGCWRNLSGLF